MQEANSTVQVKAREINLTESDIARFWKKVKKTDGDGCWEWTGFLAKKGYGIFSVEGCARMTHRVAYKAAYGELPIDRLVCHHCDNPKCVRPDHLFLGTDSENMQDAVRKGRQCYIGDDSPCAKLKTSQVLEIRRLANDGVPFNIIAKSFPVGAKQVATIHHRKTWKHLQ